MAKQDAHKVPYGEIGHSGVTIFNGIISGEEYNFNLMGRRALDTWDEMRRSDAGVKMTLRVIKEPVKALSYHVQPASDAPKDVEVAEFIDGQLFDVLRWKTTLTEILTFQEFGFSLFEKVYAFGPVKGVDRVYIKKLAFRKQTSIAKWVAANDKPGVTQYDPTGKTLPIPLDKLVVFTNEQEGDNYEGVSVLRAAYKHWYYKDRYYQIDAIAQERQGLGVVKIKQPQNANPAHVENAHVQARALRAAEEGFIDEPNGWDINFMDMKASSIKDPTPMIDHHDRKIPDSVIAGLMMLGSTSGSGSRAVGETQLKIFEHLIKFYGDFVADTINRYLIKPLVDLNFNVTEYPQLKAGDVSGESLTVLAESLSKLISAGVIVPTDEDEAYLRGILRLPEREEGDGEERTKKQPTKKTPTKEDEEELEEETDKKASVVARARTVLADFKARLYGNTSRDS